MKYYCKNCGSEWQQEQNQRKGYIEWAETPCPFCFQVHGTKIPDYETPEQYKKRTGKPVPNDMAMWYQLDDGSGLWYLMPYGWRGRYGHNGHRIINIFIADPPVPPPDGWKLEGEA
ncbi:MAG: hypothetical protein LBH43_11210 [Treponema sp.]|jgi:hypothetical protein|nr:hypothetical protein [Treponema sp.]